MNSANYDTTDPAVRTRIVGYIAAEQAEIDQWRALPADSPWIGLAPSGIEAAQAVIAKFRGLLADVER